MHRLRRHLVLRPRVPASPLEEPQAAVPGRGVACAEIARPRRLGLGAGEPVAIGLAPGAEEREPAGGRPDPVQPLLHVPPGGAVGRGPPAEPGGRRRLREGLAAGCDQCLGEGAVRAVADESLSGSH